MSKDLIVGTRRDGSPFALDANRINRHTFWCGQSGSGKTYSLGVYLEEVLLRTRVPIVILDPNSDFINFDEPDSQQPLGDDAEIPARDIRIFSRSRRNADTPLVRFLDLDPQSRAAMLRLDPILDAEEYNSLIRLEDQLRQAVNQAGETTRIIDVLRASGDPVRARIATRLENLGILRWDIWARGREDVTDAIEQCPDATVIDLASTADPAESTVMALAVLDYLWRRRHERVARFIVIDEAHNLCPPEPQTPLERLLAQRIVQIAAEGRKYGLWLVLSTQRPSKVHPNAISQCDNLALLRMSSRRDLKEIARTFGFVDSAVVNQTIDFEPGYALYAGRFVASPTIVRTKRRKTRQGGGDIEVAIR